MLKSKFLAGCLVLFALNASAQDDKTKVKPVTTTGDKVHNVIHPHHKRYSGVKAKHKTADSKTTMKTKEGEIKIEEKKDN